MTPTNPTDAQMKLADVTQADRDLWKYLLDAPKSQCTWRGRKYPSSDELQAIARHRLATEARAQGLVDAAQAFTDRLKFIHEHEAYKSVWMVNQVHCGPYDGPQYADELEALDQALATWRRT